MTRRRRGAAIVAALLLAPAVARAERVHEDEEHWSVDVPPGWRVMPRDRLEAIAGSVGLSYTMGFEPAGRAPNAHPYVVTRLVRSLSNLSSSDAFRRETTKTTNDRMDDVKQRLAPFGASVTAEPVAVERRGDGTRRVVVRTRIEVKDRTLSGYTVGMIGREGILYMGATSRAEAAARSQPAIDALMSSFRWDPGYALEPPRRGGSLWDYVLPPAIVLAIFALGVAYTRREQRGAAT